MWQNPQETADLITFTEEIYNKTLYFLCSVSFLFQTTRNVQKMNNIFSFTKTKL